LKLFVLNRNVPRGTLRFKTQKNTCLKKNGRVRVWEKERKNEIFELLTCLSWFDSVNRELRKYWCKKGEGSTQW